LHCVLVLLPVKSVEDDTPTMRDLNRYVVNKYKADWKDIAYELGFNFEMVESIKKDHSNESDTCFQKCLDSWMEGHNATWRALEVALTNVNRKKLGLDPVDDVYGMDIDLKYTEIYSRNQ